MVRQRIISCASRIEAPEHSNIEIFYQNDKISNIEVKIADGASRFFKSWLPGKLVEEIPFLVPRVCGLCSASHGICAAMALEDAYEIEPSETSRAYRQLIMSSEIVRNHIIHVGLMELPDIFAVIQGTYEPASIQGTSHPVLRDFVKNCSSILQISQKVSQVLAGGSMPVTNQVGGCFPANMDQQKIGEIAGNFDKMRIQVRALTESLANEVFLKHEPPALFQVPENWGYLAKIPGKHHLIHSTNLSCLNYDVRDLDIEDLKWFKINQSKEITIEVHKQAQVPAINDGSRIMSEFPISGITKLFEVTDKHLDLVKDQPLLTGPYARYKLNGEQKYRYERVRDLFSKIPAEWKQNTLFFSLLRLMESLEFCQNAISIIEAGINLHPDEKQLPRKPRLRQGWAAIEAPRGTLVHNYNVSPRGYVTKAQIYVPTDINLSAINSFLRLIVERLGNSPLARDPQKLLTILNIALRVFDPCISCLAQ